MNEQNTRQCIGCKITYEHQEDLAHYQSTGVERYGAASPECLADFFVILAKESELYKYPPAHRLVIDAYCVQHPPHHEHQQQLDIKQRFVDASIQSVAIHLIALYCALEKKMELPSIAAVMSAVLDNMKKHNAEFSKLPAPDSLGEMRAIDVKKAVDAKELTLEEYTQLAYRWAEAAWQAWSAHHDTVRGWYHEWYEKHL